MNRQPARRAVLHALLSALTRKAPEQAKQQVQSPRRPTLDDRDAWHSYWKEQGQPWRKGMLLFLMLNGVSIRSKE